MAAPKATRSHRRFRARRFVGLFLLLTGLIVLGQVGWLLWGTSLAEQRSQNELQTEFEQRLQLAEEPQNLPPDTTTTTTTPDTTVPSEPLTPPEPVAPVTGLPAPVVGEPVGELSIPSIGVTRMIVAGTDQTQLRRGPGWMPGTPLPGQAGNSVVAGHRTTYGQPLHNLDKMELGDLIHVKTVQGDFTYKLIELKVTEERDTSVLDGTDDNRITLIACHPKYSRRQRLIGVGILTSNPVPPMADQEILTGPNANSDSPLPNDGVNVKDELEPQPTVLRAALTALCLLVLLAGIRFGFTALRRNRKPPSPRRKQQGEPFVSVDAASVDPDGEASG